jgi:ferric-dicitrate binding protein FerR (iron transport regulator)
MVVTAGHELTIQRGGPAQLIALRNVERKFEWTQGELYLDGETLLEVAAMFNRFNVGAGVARRWERRKIRFECRSRCF